MEVSAMTDLVSTVRLRQAGQSPWLDNISRELLRSGELKSLIKESGLLGVTSNPTIFEKAISRPDGGYDADIKRFIRQGKSSFEIYDALTISDIGKTCDLFLPVFRRSKGEDGFVSLEVSPGLAYEEEKTVREAFRLFQAVRRPNVMIKVPSTPQGVRAVRRLIGMGVNINITLMFSVKHYQEVAGAYLNGLKDLNAKGGDLGKVHSVASVFVSRIDTLIDKRLEGMQEQTRDAAQKTELENLKGKAAVANSKIIYQEFKRIFGSEEFRRLQREGAAIQKVLWGSTSTKNPDYPDLIYVETMIGKNTVNTLPAATLEAFLDHGKVLENSVEEHVEESHRTVESLNAIGIDLIEAGEILQREGVKSFSDSFDSLMRTLEKKRAGKSSTRPSVKVSCALSPCLAGAVRQRAEQFEKENFLPRLLQGDSTLWTQDPAHQAIIRNRMGWLGAAEWALGRLHEIQELKQEITRDKIQDIILLGMGGSSLAPEVMDLILRRPSQRPGFHVLDTTDPASVLRVEKTIRLRYTLFIVASKSGSTLETVSQYRYFYEKVQKVLKENAGRNFIAITDSGSALESLAREQNFRKAFINPSDIGGRYSALSFFGLVPAMLTGINGRLILEQAIAAFKFFAEEKTIQKNQAVNSGIVLGELARAGQNKVMIWTSRSLGPFGAWLEQLIAESTGKEGKGIIPVDGDDPAPSGRYGKDCAFLVFSLKGEKTAALQNKIAAVKKAGFSVIGIEWQDKMALGAEFLNWEIATVVSSAVLAIDPFDEPNVQESKDNTGRLLKGFEKSKKFPAGKNLLPWNAAKGKRSASSRIQPALKKILSGVGKNSYISLLAFLDRSPETREILGRIQRQLRDLLHRPVLVGFGPRYLHSIGQLYKGGPRQGVFLILLTEPKNDIKIPGASYTFGQLKKAQALGDLQAFQKRDLPVLAVMLEENLMAGLRGLAKGIKAITL